MAPEDGIGWFDAATSEFAVQQKNLLVRLEFRWPDGKKHYHVWY